VDQAVLARMKRKGYDQRPWETTGKGTVHLILPEPLRRLLLLYLYCRAGIQESERLSSLPEATQQMNDGIGI
jgi:hypothetical protein